LLDKRLCHGERAPQVFFERAGIRLGKRAVFVAVGRYFVAALLDFLNQSRQPLGNPPENKEGGFTAVFIEKIEEPPERAFETQGKRVPGIA
jgi:hypothetical protein